MKELTCPYCGITSKDVSQHWEYIIGRGLVQITACSNLSACGKRVRQIKPLKCRWCGHEGHDVNYHTVYLGGHGDVYVLECDNASDCSKRQDEQLARKPELVGAK